MKHSYKPLFLLLLLPGLLPAQTAQRPDLSGVWSFVIDLPPVGLKTQSGGNVAVKTIDRGYAAPIGAAVSGALPSAKEPTYKPEFRAKVKDLFDHESKTDPVFYCGRPGIPRIGPPRKIVQLPTETIFFYEDISGDPYRIIPTGNRPDKRTGNPSTYGTSAGHWDGNAFVVDVTNFVDDSWFGEGGYFHSDAMHVTERLWRVGDNLAYQATVEDPKVLASPWVMPVKVVKPSTEPLEESPFCKETDINRMVNDDHHVQR